MNTTRWMTCTLAALSLAACDQGGQNAEPLRITGDTLIQVKTIAIDGVAQAAQCRGTLGAFVDDEKTAVTITDAHVRYFMADTTQIAEMKWTEQDITKLWPQNTIRAGAPQASMPLDISISLPVRPVRGEVNLRYRVNEEDEKHDTPPFTFRCE